MSESDINTVLSGYSECIAVNTHFYLSIAMVIRLKKKEQNSYISEMYFSFLLY